jgi:hypothetical protein
MTAPPEDLAPEALFKELDPDTRESGLRLDRSGQWHHEGVPVAHARLHRALTRWLERDPETGRFRLRVGPDWWAWVDVEDAPYQAQLLAVDEAGLHLRLSDERKLTFAGEALLVGGDDAWYVPLDEPGLEARLARGAMSSLAEHLQEAPETELGVCLALPGPRRVDFAPRPTKLAPGRTSASLEP